MSGATAALALFVVQAELSVEDRDAAARSRHATRIAVEVGRETAALGRAAAVVQEDGATPASASGRAWLSAAAAAASGLDDTLDYGSAGAPVWAALQALGSDDDDVLVEAGGVGMRAALGLWTAGRYREAERGFSGSTVFGVIAVVCACARLLRLDLAATRSAIAIAASLAGGLGVDDGTDARILRIAAAARDGLQAALLARVGFAGAPDMLEGRQGFGEAFFGLPISELTDLGAALAAGSLTRLRVKDVPGHEHHQRPVAALARLLREHPGREVQQVIVEDVPPASGGTRFSTPATPEQAARSLRHALAVTLARGTVAPDDLAHPLGAEALDRIVVRATPRWDARLADPDFVAGHVAVRFTDGGLTSAQLD
jgi:2-methylcitrate dehydratase PrpD